MTLHLYHGTSIGWLKLTGFAKALKPYGEFTIPHEFIYLATNPEGAANAAFKASKAAKKRLDDGTLLAADFVYAGTPYTVNEYVYRAEVSPNSLIFDMAVKQLSKRDLKLLRKAVWLGRSSNLAYVGACLKNIRNPHAWRETFEEAIAVNGECPLNRQVYVLGMAGVDLIKNIERDSDGQSYGEVYALPLEKLSCVSIL
jgi:hypothetical protein